MPWLVSVFERRLPDYDSVNGEAWLKENVLRNPTFYLGIRTRNAWLVSGLDCNMWKPDEWYCNTLGGCADFGAVWEMVPLVRASMEWAKKRGAVRWNWQSDTPFDIGPLMRRVGAKPLTPRYGVIF
jgi:hypothetical protein